MKEEEYVCRQNQNISTNII